MSTELKASDRLVLIAADDSTIAFDRQSVDNPVEHSALTSMSPSSLPHLVERTLVIGWNRYARRILVELDRHALPGSTLQVMVDTAAPEDFDESLLEDLQNHTYSVVAGSITDAEEVQRCLALGPWDHILILCAHDGLSAVDADARALLALMHVRNALNNDINGDSGRVNLVTEMLKTESVDLAQIARPDDFIVSQRLVSLYIAQLAEHPQRRNAIDQLLESGGVQVALVPADSILSQTTFTFADVVRAAARNGDVAIGWRISDVGGTDETHRFKLNPPKSDRVSLEEVSSLILLSRR
jgi:hypothetical protein